MKLKFFYTLNILFVTLLFFQVSPIETTANAYSEIPYDKWCEEADKLLQTNEVQNLVANEITEQYFYYGIFHDFSELSVSRSFQMPHYDYSTGRFTNDNRDNLVANAYCLVYCGDILEGYLRLSIDDKKITPCEPYHVEYWIIDNVGNTVTDKCCIFESYSLDSSSSNGYRLFNYVHNGKAYPIRVNPNDKYCIDDIKEYVETIPIDQKELSAYDVPKSSEIMFTFGIAPKYFEDGVYTIRCKDRYLSYKNGKLGLSTYPSDSESLFLISRTQNNTYTISPKIKPNVKLKVHGKDKFYINQVVREYIITDDNGNMIGNHYFRIYTNNGKVLYVNGNKVVFTPNFGYENADWLLYKADDI